MRDPCFCDRCRILGARAIAQRHTLKPLGAAGGRLDTAECLLGCSTLELLCAMACCCLDEHFGLATRDAAAGSMPARRSTPRWIRRIDDDPLLTLYSRNGAEVDVESPDEEEMDAVDEPNGSRTPREVGSSTTLSFEGVT